MKTLILKQDEIPCTSKITSIESLPTWSLDPSEARKFLTPLLLNESVIAIINHDVDDSLDVVVASKLKRVV